jgi:hypothetical protein
LSCFPLSHYDALMQFVIKTTSSLTYMTTATRILKFDKYFWKIHYHDDVLKSLDKLQQQHRQQYTKQLIDEMIHRTNEFVMRAVNMLYYSNNSDTKCYHLNDLAKNINDTIPQPPKPIIMSIQESLITPNNSELFSSISMKPSTESLTPLLYDDQNTSNDNNTVDGVEKTNQCNLIAVCIKLNKNRQPNDDDDEINDNDYTNKDIFDTNNDAHQWDYDKSGDTEITVKAIKTMIAMKNQGDVSFLPGQLLSLSSSYCTEAIPTKTTATTITSTLCSDTKPYDYDFDQHGMLHKNHKRRNKYENINITNYDDINFKYEVQDDHDVQKWHHNNQKNDCNDKDTLANHRLTNKSIAKYCHEDDDNDSSAKNCQEESNDSHSHWYLVYWIPIPCRNNMQEASTTSTTTATVAATSSALPTPQANQRSAKPISLGKKHS